MRKSRKNHGFSLTEVLLAVGTLTIGMVFVAGVFPVAIHFTTIATERTIAAVLADEAFAKIRLYAEGDLSDDIDDIDLNELEENELTGFYDVNVFPAAVNIPPCEFAYPSDPNISILRKQYCWSALCRLTEEYNVNNPNPLVQVTVFVSRRTSSNLEYPDPNVGGVVDWPRPVKVGVEDVDGAMNELRIRFRSGAYSDRTFINDGYTIVDDRTGRIYRVLERYVDEPDTILLDRDWDDDIGEPKYVWVVPPPVNGNRYPCIAIYQKVIRF